MVKLDFCTTVSPDEYDWLGQFERAMKAANQYHKRTHEECPPPYFMFDAGKVYGLVMKLKELMEKEKEG